MTRWPSLIVSARAVAESIPPDRRTTAVSTIVLGMHAEGKGVASRDFIRRASRSRARIDRRAGPHVDGLPSLDEVPPTDRSHALPGREGRPPDRTAAVRELPGTPLRVCSIPRTFGRYRSRRKPGTTRGPPDALRTGIEGSPPEPYPGRNDL